MARLPTATLDNCPAHWQQKPIPAGMAVTATTRLTGVFVLESQLTPHLHLSPTGMAAFAQLYGVRYGHTQSLLTNAAQNNAIGGNTAPREPIRLHLGHSILFAIRCLLSCFRRQASAITQPNLIRTWSTDCCMYVDASTISNGTSPALLIACGDALPGVESLVAIPCRRPWPA